jgi:hypothetical protein
MMNAISTSKIISFIICSICLMEKFEWCYVDMETTRYSPVREQDRNRGFHMNWPIDNSGEYQSVISLGLQAIIKDVLQNYFFMLIWKRLDTNGSWNKTETEVFIWIDPQVIVENIRMWSALGYRQLKKMCRKIIFSSLNIDLCTYIMSRYGLFFILMYI